MSTHVRPSIYFVDIWLQTTTVRFVKKYLTLVMFHNVWMKQLRLLLALSCTLNSRLHPPPPPKKKQKKNGHWRSESTKIFFAWLFSTDFGQYENQCSHLFRSAKVIVLLFNEREIPKFGRSLISKITLGISAYLSASCWHVYAIFDQGTWQQWNKVDIQTCSWFS